MSEAGKAVSEPMQEADAEPPREAAQPETPHEAGEMAQPELLSEKPELETVKPVTATPPKAPESAHPSLWNPDKPGEQISLFPSEAEQIQTIREAESVATPSASPISQEEMDIYLRMGSNTEHARKKIVTEYAKHNPEITAYLKRAFHHGYGIQTESGQIAAWAMEDGIHFARGDRVRYVQGVQVLPWEDAMRRISQLLDEGRFASNVELAEAPGFERQAVATSLLYLFDEAEKQGYLSRLREIDDRGFDVVRDRIAELLEKPETRAPVVEDFRQFVIAWRQDRDLLRFQYHQPAVLLRRLNDLNTPRREFHSDMTAVPEVRAFITEDEINDVFQRATADFRIDTLHFWQESHTAKEKAAYLRNYYGESGNNSAVSGEFHSWVSYKPKGVELRKPLCSDVQINWANIVRRLDALIAEGHYVTPEELEQYQAAHLEDCWGNGTGRRLPDGFAPERAIPKSPSACPVF